MKTVRPKGFGPAIIAGLLGTTLEYYDLVLVGVLAVVVFPSVFYPQLNPAIAVGLSIATYGVTFITRPLGGFLFGYLGDKRGRKFTFMWTMIITSIAVLAISVMPPYSVIGYSGIALILILRLVQGIGLGGEFGTAAVFLAEFSKDSKWRGFWTQWVSNGIMIGSLLSIVANLFAANLMPTAQYLLYGWRVLFVFGACLGLLAILIRFKVGETDLFKELEDKKEISKSPIKEVLKAQWGSCLRLCFMTALPIAGMSFMTIPFGNSYLMNLGATSNVASLGWAGGAAVAVFLTMLGGIAADKIGRRLAYFIGAACALAAELAYFPLLSTLNIYLAILANASVLGATFFALATIPAIASETFPTKHRTSGLSIGYQFGALEGGIIISFVIPVVISTAGGVVKAWPGVMAITFGVTVVSIISILTMRETRDVKLSEI